MRGCPSGWVSPPRFPVDFYLPTADTGLAHVLLWPMCLPACWALCPLCRLGGPGMSPERQKGALRGSSLLLSARRGCLEPRGQDLAPACRQGLGESGWCPWAAGTGLLNAPPSRHVQALGSAQTHLELRLDLGGGREGKHGGGGWRCPRGGLSGQWQE